ncbi:hypothetical protein [Dyadobacter sandarakinus]|uniref:Uncharacterized protein n=1 Tax=Dyadobacter sandarakinus TaxID=2747268 RepID=A0ABX7I1Y3_9BACT|nr:hypothetical protein [Dyadobacter sandarakinus]QRR00079.1 hypothetical protein HWI92_03700 [Dyadobacter sandarakinus]
MKKLLFLLLIFLSGAAHAHVGSSGVQMQAQAGPYQVLVSVLPPDVIPGTASISVFVETGKASRMTARPIYFKSGGKGAPSADALEVVPGQPGQFKGIVWFMEGGSSSVQIHMEGDQGSAELIVPMMAVSTAQRGMPQGLGLGLSILGLLLFLLIITTIGASVSDALLPAGASLSAAQKRKRWMNMGIAAVVCTLVLYGGSSWWNSWAEEYSQYMYRPLQGTSRIRLTNNQRIFELEIDTTDWQARNRGSMLSTLIPDHGKLMHTFLIRIPAMDAFAHVHPERKDSTTFQSVLPGLPAGKYLVYADIVRYSGFAETITDTLLIPERKDTTAVAPLPSSAEDAFVITNPIDAREKGGPADNFVICGKPGSKTVFQDGSYVVWEGQGNEALEAGKPYQLKFAIFNPDGSACLPEPYLGMLGHAAVVRTDGSVYIHLHPAGSFPMAAGQLFKNRLADTTKVMKRPVPAVFRDSVDRYLSRLAAMSVPVREEFLMTEMGMYDTSDASMSGMNHTNLISFPYSFPKEGSYRLFLQVKRNDRVLTGAFDVKVRGTDGVL